MQKSNIDWCEFTSNPVKGECPVDCSYCYVKDFRQRYGWHKDIRFYPEELAAIRKRKKPAKIFVGSTIELFHDKTIQYMPEIMETIRACPQHTIILLTKQPQNLIKFSPFPDNCWVGVSITENNTDAGSYLAKVEAKVKYISFEPLLRWAHYPQEILMEVFDRMGIAWVIIGAQTGSLNDLVAKKAKDQPKNLAVMPYGKKWTLQPKIEWVKEIVQACDKAGIPVFLKTNLEPLFKPLMRVPNMAWWGNVFGLKQEMPK